MASTVLFSYPDIPDRAIDIATQETYSDFRPVFNLFKGHRSHHGQLDTIASSTRYIDFKLASDDLRTADHLIIAKASYLLERGITDVTVQRSSDYSTWTTVDTESLATNLFVGPRSEDLILTFNQTSAYRYWRVYFNGDPNTLRFSKLYLGNFYDIGVDPDEFTFNYTNDGNLDFLADSGATHTAQYKTDKAILRLMWQGVSDAKANQIMNGLEVLRSNATGLFVYAPDQTQILNDHILLHCEVLNVSKDDLFGYPDYNNITITFQEMIG